MNRRFRQLVALGVDYAFVSLCLLVFLAAGLSGIFLRRSVSRLEQEHAFVREDGEAVLRTIAGATALRNDRVLLDAAVRSLNANLITEDNLADNLGYFYKLEDQSHARISELHQLSSAAVGSGGTVKTIPFSVNVTGSFAEVISYLHQLEHGPRLMKITAFSFNRRIPTGDTVVLQLNLEMLARP